MVTAEHLIDALELYVNEEIISKVAGLKKMGIVGTCKASAV